MIDTERIAELIEYIVFLIVTHCGVKRLINCCTTALLLHVVSSACRSTVPGTLLRYVQFLFL